MICDCKDCVCKEIHIASPSIGELETSAASRALLSGCLVGGPETDGFEREFASYVGASLPGVSTSSGTTALHLALLALGVDEHSVVITTPFSFVSTATAVLMCGASLAFADVDENGNLSPQKTEEMIEVLLRNPEYHKIVILPVHLYGNPVNVSQFLQIASRYEKVEILYDACQAHGAEYAGYPVGSYGTSCWSFYATKNLTTGEGGMVTTSDEEIRERLVSLRSHGQCGNYQFSRLGYNYRMTEAQAAIGRIQLTRAHRLQMQRRSNVFALTMVLSGIHEIDLPTEREGTTHAWHQYTIVVKSGEGRRDSLLYHLAKHKIFAKVYYPTLIPDTTLFKSLDYCGHHLKKAVQLSKSVLSLPVHPGLNREDMARIGRIIEEWAS